LLHIRRPAGGKTGLQLRQAEGIDNEANDPSYGVAQQVWVKQV
jgi:hypothetical protein